MATVCRRASEPRAVQQLWDAIRSIRAQKQIANEDRVVRHVQREHDDCTADTASVQLHRAVTDGLIIAYRPHQQKIGTDGSEQIAYRLPDEDQVCRVTDLIMYSVPSSCSQVVQCIPLILQNYFAFLLFSVFLFKSMIP